MSALRQTHSPIRIPRTSAVSACCGQLCGAIPLTLRVRNIRHAATRMKVSVGVAVVVAATVMPLPTALASDTPPPPPDRTALVLGGTTVPTPDSAYIDAVRNHFIGPIHPGQVTYVPVTAPMEFWPITGAGRLLWLAFGPPSVWGLDGPGWPDEPLWKLSGLFDVTFGQSLNGGVAALEGAMAAQPSDHLVIYGYSQGAMIAVIEKRKLAAQYPDPATAPDIDFVLSGDLNLPNGGLSSRFPGLYIPIFDVPFSGAEPTDTAFHTTVITRQYDGLADLPLYPLNLVSLLNAVLGIVYTHPRDLEVSLDDPAHPPIHTQFGDTDYYFFESENLPLFDPLRTVGVPESLIDVVEPVARDIVELGYDRTIPPGQPTPARLLPPSVDPAKVTADLVNAIGEGFNNALALFGLPPLLGSPAAPETGSAKADLADDVDGTIERNLPDKLNGTVEQNPADKLNGTVEQNPTDKLNGTVEQNPADDLDRTVESNPTDNLDGNPADVRDRNQQKTLTGTRQTTSTGPSRRTRQTTSTGPSSGTRQTVRGDANLPSAHSAADGSQVQNAAPSADARRLHRDAADTPHRAAGLQGTDTA
jgi:hypothetical protein